MVYFRGRKFFAFFQDVRDSERIGLETILKTTQPLTQTCALIIVMCLSVHFGGVTSPPPCLSHPEVSPSQWFSIFWWSKKRSARWSPCNRVVVVGKRKNRKTERTKIERTLCVKMLSRAVNGNQKRTMIVEYHREMKTHEWTTPQRQIDNINNNNNNNNKYYIYMYVLFLRTTNKNNINNNSNNKI